MAYLAVYWTVRDFQVGNIPGEADQQRGPKSDLIHESEIEDSAVF